jgi:hypothetical protein
MLTRPAIGGDRLLQPEVKKLQTSLSLSAAPVNGFLHLRVTVYPVRADVFLLLYELLLAGRRMISCPKISENLFQCFSV